MNRYQYSSNPTQAYLKLGDRVWIDDIDLKGTTGTVESISNFGAWVAIPSNSPYNKVPADGAFIRVLKIETLVFYPLHKIYKVPQ